MTSNDDYDILAGTGIKGKEEGLVWPVDEAADEALAKGCFDRLSEKMATHAAAEERKAIPDHCLHMQAMNQNLFGDDTDAAELERMRDMIEAHAEKVMLQKIDRTMKEGFSQAIGAVPTPPHFVGVDAASQVWPLKDFSMMRCDHGGWIVMTFAPLAKPIAAFSNFEEAMDWLEDHT